VCASVIEFHTLLSLRLGFAAEDLPVRSTTDRSSLGVGDRVLDSRLQVEDGRTRRGASVGQCLDRQEECAQNQLNRLHGDANGV
jgi:hypothetical protein